MGMNSRQRVTAAINHEEADRVPFDCLFGYSAYVKLKDYLGFSESAEVVPSSPGLTVRPSVEFLQALNVDLCYLGLEKGGSEPRFVYGMDRYVDEWGIPHSRIETLFSISYEVREHPLAHASIEDLDDYPWPDPHDPARVAGLEERCRQLLADTDLALVGRFNTPIFEQAILLRGYERFLVDTVANPEFAAALLAKTTHIAMGLLQVGLQACGKYIQILRLAGDDMGHQTGTILSPHAFRHAIKPRFAQLYRYAKATFRQHNPEGRMMAHTDGDVFALIPDYIEMGLDILNPVQPHVTNMDHGRLKREFGSQLSFHGGIDIQRLMPFGTPDEVRSEVATTMKVLGEGGGYIVAPTHYLQPDVPPENIVALRDAVLELGRYPLDRHH